MFPFELLHENMGVGGVEEESEKVIFYSFYSRSRSSLSALTRAETRATLQLVKKVVSNSLGLVDFAIGLVIFVLNLPNGQVLFLGKIQITEGL